MAALQAAYQALFDVEAQKPQATTSALHTEEPGSRRRACPQKNNSQGKKRRHRTDACVEVGEDVFRLPPVLDEQTCRAAVNEVDDRVALGLSTTRGAQLPTTDVYVRDLRCAAAIHEAVDAGLHLMERCTGRLVDCKKEEIFIITYCATGRRSLGRHTDGDGKRTLLITLDASRDYAGGGTRFYPKEASAPSFVVRPARGAAVAFDGSVEHEGEAVVGGRRHVVVVFATEVDEDERRPSIRAAQRRAAQSVFAAPPPSPRRHQRRAPRAASAYRSLF